MTKSDYRKILKKINTEANDKKVYDEIIFQELLKIIAGKKKIAYYKAINDEVNIERLILCCNFEIYAPAIKEKLIFKKVTNNFKVGKYNILEPIGENGISINELDAIIIPCLGVSKSGYRLGYGKGYYDYALQDYQGIKIGICYSSHIIEDVHQNHDVILDYIVTEKGIIEVKNNV